MNLGGRWLIYFFIINFDVFSFWVFFLRGFLNGFFFLSSSRLTDVGVNGFFFLSSGFTNVGEFQLVLSKKCKRDGFLYRRLLGFLSILQI